MKFVCNNCGFTADIPEPMSACPMCGSSNVSSAAEASNLTVNADEHDGEKNTVPQKNLRAEGPTQRVTLTEGMNIGDQPVVKPVAKPEKKSCKACKICIALVVVLLVFAAAAAAAFFFFFK